MPPSSGRQGRGRPDQPASRSLLRTGPSVGLGKPGAGRAPRSSLSAYHTGGVGISVPYLAAAATRAGRSGGPPATGRRGGGGGRAATPLQARVGAPAPPGAAAAAGAGRSGGPAATGGVVGSVASSPTSSKKRSCRPPGAWVRSSVPLPAPPSPD